MKNWYQILGLADDASAIEIKKAYHTQALSNHPDKGGNSEKMQELNEAYRTLSNANIRADFDKKFSFFKEFNDEPNTFVAAGYLTKTSALPFSVQFKQKHKELFDKYQLKPIEKKNWQDIAKIDLDFTYNHANLTEFLLTSEECLKKPTEIKSSVSMLLNAFYGNCSSNQIKDFFKLQLKNQAKFNEYEFKVHQAISAILDIFWSNDFENIKPNLLTDFQIITNYVTNCDPIPAYLIILLQNKTFRNLFQKSLQSYWLNTPIDSKDFANNNSLKELVKLLEQNFDQDNKLIVPIKLLNQFAKQEIDSNASEKLRAQAFHILDWVPAIGEYTTTAILVNILIQAALHLQLSAINEKNATQAMASERLALEIYFTAFVTTQDFTPDLMLYAGCHIVHALTKFNYLDAESLSIVEAIKSKMLTLYDIFPIFIAPKANADFIKDPQEKTLTLMRNYLQAMYQVIEYNQLSDEPIAIEHDKAALMYQSYEACLKNWYRRQYDFEEEKRIRLNLMYELLTQNDWSDEDIIKNLDFSWQVPRDNEGWICPTDELSLGNNNNCDIFNSIAGIEINLDKGKIYFHGQPWDEVDDDVAEKALTVADLKEVITKGIDSAFFSLEQVDPQKPYHPFNQMRFAPSNLYGTEFLKTMLWADYLLKFLTMNQEVQGQFPFDIRPLDKFLEPLPRSLKKVINDFHQSQKDKHNTSVHRFWIEAVDVPFAQETFSKENNYGTMCFGFDKVKMVIKKHLMIRDAEGNLIDADESKEGWNFYLLTNAEIEEVKDGSRNLESPAIIFRKGCYEVYFYEDNKLSANTYLDDRHYHFDYFFKQQLDNNKKIIIDAYTESAMYDFTRYINREHQKPLYFTPEYIFAQELTWQYNSFSGFFPVLGRLRELSGLAAMVKFLKSVRENNNENITKLKEQLNDPNFWQSVQQEIDENISNIEKAYNKQFYDTKAENVRSLTDSCAKWNRVYRQISYSQTSQLYDQVRNLIRTQLNIYVSYSEAESLCQDENSYIIENIAEQITIKQFSKASIDKDKVIGELYNKIKELKLQLTAKISGLENLEQEFKNLGLCKDEKEVNLEKKCLWVPACINHEVRSENGLDKSSRFVYGGVLVNARTNLLAQGSGRANAVLNQAFNNNGGAGANRPPINNQQVNNSSFNRREITRGFQDHHIISNKNRITSNHRLLDKAGYNLDSRSNKVFLPKHPDSHPSRSVHNGRHLNSVSQRLTRKMDHALYEGKQNNWSKDQYNDALRNIIREERIELKAGNIKLNKSCRPWAK